MKTTRHLNFIIVLLISFIFISCSEQGGQNTVHSRPDSTRYTIKLLIEGLDEPMAMQILPDNDVLIIERKGAIKLYKSVSKKFKTIAHINVFTGIEDGLLGAALDPQFKTNRWVYFYYAVQGDKAINRLSRFEFRDESLVASSEKILLEIPTQRKYCCHAGGSIAFGPDNSLYLSTGDNTNAEEAEGYVPVDERPGHELADDQATAANNNDLRGKILRIKPEANGGYTIPKGNLFPADGSAGRPEIYVMGCRNPFRISVDQKTGFLYWGDVGPFTSVPGEEGTLSYDEINQAKKPGFYGWPYFLGNNEPFPHYDFASKKAREKHDARKPINNSPNNTGSRELPAAQPALIWYGRLASKRWPLVGKGGASAMAGPVFYSDMYSSDKVKLPDYYNGKLFIYDWVRRWIMAVSLDSKGNYVSMEPFLNHLKLAAPMDIKIGSDGAMYVLEYGTNWFSKNADARLVRIEYTEGNRNPVANIITDKLYGASPLTVRFSGDSSMDYDGGKLKYEWHVQGKKLTGNNINYTFDKAGVFDVGLTVSDEQGGNGTATIQIKVGNTPPEVNILSDANRSFYWDNSFVDYNVKITDREDSAINNSRAGISMRYIEHGKDLASGIADDPGSQVVEEAPLIANLDCKTCHSMDASSVGPAFKEIAARYHGKPGVSNQLADKIIKGGSGNWGTREMMGHPEMSQTDAKKIADYILALNDQKAKLPLHGKFQLKEHIGKPDRRAHV